jgi:hypothetical protein
MVPDLSLIMSNGSLTTSSLNTTQTPGSASMLSNNNNTSTKSSSEATTPSLDDMKKELKELPISLGRIEAKMDKILELQQEIFEKLARHHKMSMESSQPASTSKDDKPHFSPMTSGYDEHKHFQRYCGFNDIYINIIFLSLLFIQIEFGKKLVIFQRR